MPTYFAAPALPRPIAGGLFELSAIVAATLNAAEIAKLRESLEFDEGRQAHVRIREAMKIDGNSFQVSGSIGIHEASESGSEGDEEAGLHVALLARRSAHPQLEDTQAEWHRFVEALGPIWSEVPFDVRMVLDVPVQGVSLAVKLPVNLKGSEIVGFSQISGMRLVQADTEDPAEELYSAIIQHHGTSVSVQTSNVAALSFDENLFSSVAAQALSVAKLAITSLEIE